MYRSSPLDYPKEKVCLFQTNEREETISAQEVQGEEEEEVEDEYDSTRTVKMNILWKKMMTIYEGSNNA